MMSQSSQVFFFDQKIILIRKKRRRKHPDELPRSLRFANLNPRLAAFLSSQERQKNKKAQEGEGGEEGHDREDGKGADGFLRRGNGRRGSLDSLDEGDYSQRQMYHEAVVAGPTLLVQLSKILYLFENEQLDLPRELVNCLQSSYRDLTTEVQYTRYEWQCPENVPREDAKEGEGGAKKLEADQPQEENGADGDRGDKKKRRKKKVEDGEEEGEKSVMESTIGSVMSSRDLQGGAVSSSAGPSQKPKSKVDKGKTQHKADLVDRRVSTSTSNHRMSVASKLGAETSTILGEGQPEVVHQPNFLQVISFSMSSKVCEEKGWILEKEETEKEFEQRTVLEWARERLQQAMELSKEQLQREKDLGRDRPLYLRYYGDAKREAMLKYKGKRGTSKPQSYSAGKVITPKLPQAALSNNQHKVITGLPDGTMNVFYPSGKLAMITSKAGFGHPGYYTIAYNDNASHDMLATFTPTGKGSCYHPNGMVKFLSTEKMGMLMDTEGVVVRKWAWPLPHLRMATPVIFHLNHNISFRCHNRTQMTLSFLCHKETTKVQVGQVLMAMEPVTQEDLGFLETEENFQSNAAKESIRPPPIIKKPPKREVQRWKAKGTPSQHPKVVKMNAFKEQVAEIAKSLQMEEKTEYGIPAEKELAVLGRKMRLTCEDWMDHYRIAVGIMQLMNVTALPKRRKRGVQSAKVTSSQHRVEEDQTDGDKPVMALALKARVPSAPAMSCHKKRPFSTVSTWSTGRSSRSTSTRATERRERVRMDVDDDEGAASKPGTPAKFSTISGNVAGGGDRSRSPASRVAMSTISNDKKKPSPLTGCPVALRAEMLGDTMATCRCSRHRIPNINDLELERFLSKEVPRSQLAVVCVTSSLLPDSLPCSDMLLQLYERQNRNRTKPCYQSRSDAYRMFLYDVAMASQQSNHSIPDLFTRHNAVPGMFLIYANSHLLFCDHIFNGYGNARKDFQKQLLKSRRDASLGKILPPDFHFSPTYGRRGPRSAWGGEIGGTRERRFSGFPRLHGPQGGHQRHSSASSLADQSRSSSTVTSLEQITLLRPSTTSRHVDSSAADFMSLSISYNGSMQVAS